ncbi:MAG: DUF2779 domain-containing protein [Gammaproteobacteria bacterium]|jgi:hypothetical protein
MMHLTKTLILAGLQCEKRLFLTLNHPERAQTAKSPLAATGIAVGEQARKEFPGGVLVKRFQNNTDPFAETIEYINDPEIDVIFEAGFRYQETEVFVDILQRNGNGWNLIEVKSSSSVKDEYIDDVAVQYMVLSNAGISVKRVELMYLNRDFIYHAEQGYDGLFIREDLSQRVFPHVDPIVEHVNRIRRNISTEEPENHVDGHCNRPYECEFKTYCEKQDGDYPVSWLPNAAVAIQNLYANDIYDIRDIPADMLTSATHIKVRRVTVNGRAELDPDACKVLQRLEYPRYYLDFEAVNFAIPVWEDTSPNQQIPFQWSCHIQLEDGGLSHKEFLDVSGSDPRRRFAETLIDTCGTEGTIIVYNQAFEKGMIRSLAAIYDDIEACLLALNQRIFDLLPVMKKYYYHPDMKGSWSIKNVLSCLVPDLRYSDLGAVQDGLMAQSAYLEMTSGDLSAEQKQSLYADLQQYCKLDTYAMLAIVDKVCD